MKLIKKAKKGFTLVELVVVIAVIAILAGVSIITYTGIINKANETKAMEAARGAYMNWYTSVGNADDIDIKSSGYVFHVEDGSFLTDAKEDRDNVPNYEIENGTLVPEVTE